MTLLSFFIFLSAGSRKNEYYIVLEWRGGEDGRYVGIYVSCKILRQYVNNTLYNYNIQRNITKNRKIKKYIVAAVTSEQVLNVSY
mgnify:CR=1 FL=1